MCKNIAAGLAEFYPDKQPLIEQNLSAVTAEYEAAQTYGEEETLKATFPPPGACDVPRRLFLFRPRVRP